MYLKGGHGQCHVMFNFRLIVMAINLKLKLYNMHSNMIFLFNSLRGGDWLEVVKTSTALDPGLFVKAELAFSSRNSFLILRELWTSLQGACINISYTVTVLIAAQS